MSNVINIILVDDHPMVVKGLRACLSEYDDLHVLSTMESGEELLNSSAHSDCDIVLLDVNLSGLSGIETTEKFLAGDPKARILIFSMMASPDYARHAMAAGAQGYLLKDAMPEELVTAIRTVANGGTYFSSEIAVALANSAPEPVAKLSETELTVLRRVAEGKSSKEIAREAEVSVRTIETHRRNLRLKLGAQTVAECVQIAVRRDLI